MPINKETLWQWIVENKIEHPGDDNVVAVHRPSRDLGYWEALSRLSQWMEDNACDHERARYESTYRDYERTGTAYARAFPYCPDCGKKMDL